MQRTTTPAAKAEAPQTLLQGEFDKLLTAKGTKLVEVNPDGIGEVVEVLPELSNDVATMIYEAPMEKAMATSGITRQFLASLLKEAMEATQCTVFLDQKTGDILYSKELINWKVREDARRDAHTLLNHYPPERQEVSGPNGSAINLKTGPAVQAIIQEIQVTVLGGENTDPPVDGN
jgi:hypothetical protein